MSKVKSIPQAHHGLIDGDLLVFSVCAAVEYGAEEEELNTKMFKSICRSIDAKLRFILERLDLRDCTIFFSSSNNFRHTLMPEYKANRKDVWRPHFLSDAKEYVQEWWGSELVEGLEADDLMAMRQDKEDYSTVIITIDKDLLQVGGHHYRWETQHRGEEKLFVNGLGHLEEDGKKIDGMGMLFFLHQCLIGDPTDGIMGCGVQTTKVYKTGAKAGQEYQRRQGVGAKTSYALLKDCKTYEEGLEVVKKEYQKVFGSQWQIELNKQGGCVWMVRDFYKDQYPIMWDFRGKDEFIRAYHPIKKSIGKVKLKG